MPALGSDIYAKIFPSRAGESAGRFILWSNVESERGRKEPPSDHIMIPIEADSLVVRTAPHFRMASLSIPSSVK